MGVLDPEAAYLTPYSVPGLGGGRAPAITIPQQSGAARRRGPVGVAAASPRRDQPRAGYSGVTSADGLSPYAAWLLDREADGNWSIVNSDGYSGAFQFGEAALQDAGVYTPGTGGRWSGTFNIPGLGTMDYDTWLHSPKAQVASLNAWNNNLLEGIRSMGLDRYIGQVVNGVPITLEGLLGGAHIGGLGGVQTFLTGRGDPADANGTRVSDYIREAGAAAGGAGMAMPPDLLNSVAPAAGGSGMASGASQAAPAPPARPRSLWDMLVNGGSQSGAESMAMNGLIGALLRAGAPSTDPANGSLFGAIANGLDAWQQGQFVGEQVDDKRSQRDARARLMEVAGGMSPEMQAVAAAYPEQFAAGLAGQAFTPAAPPQTRTITRGDQEVTQEWSPTAGWQDIGTGPRWQTTPRAPETRSVTRGDQQVTQEFDPATGKWRDVGSGPRWQTTDDRTTLERNLIAAGLIPGTPEFKDAMIAGIRSGNTNVTLDMGAGGDPANVSATEAAKAAGGALGGYFTDMMKTGQQAQAALSDINALDALLQRTPTGTLTPFANQIAGIARSVGIDVGNADLSSAEAIQSIVARIAPNLRPTGSGSSSDRDVALFLQSLPSLSNTPEGNRIIVSILRSMAERKQQEGQIALQWASGELTSPKALSILQGLGPFISPEQAAELARLAGSGSSVDPATIPLGTPPASAPTAAPMGDDPLGLFD